MRLEEDKLEALRRWGLGLRDKGGEEHAAAGRAILMLIDEIERLRLELARTRELAKREDSATDEAGGDTNEPLASTLRARLSRAAGRDSEGTESGAASEGAAASPQAWIESLRRQE